VVDESFFYMLYEEWKGGLLLFERLKVDSMGFAGRFWGIKISGHVRGTGAKFS